MAKILCILGSAKLEMQKGKVTLGTGMIARTWACKLVILCNDAIHVE